MKLRKELERLYVECVDCDATRKQCPIAWKDRRIGMIPRGFEPSLSIRPKLLVVAKNPGHPLDKFGERQRYIGRRGKGLLNSWLKWRDHVLKIALATPDKSFKYHKNRNRYLRFILGHSKRLETYHEYSQRTRNRDVVMKDYSRIMRSVAMTNLLKCSTKNEQQKLEAPDVALCYRKFFVREIGLIRPSAILAFGNDVDKIVRKLDSSGELPPVVKIRHPTVFYREGSEEEKLEELRTELIRYL